MCINLAIELKKLTKAQIYREQNPQHPLQAYGFAVPIGAEVSMTMIGQFLHSF